MDRTLSYYSDNARSFASQTYDADIRSVQEMFLSYLHKGDRILDAGCGCGRDCRYFIDRGFNVEAFDGCPELCAIASEKAGIAVRNMLFDDISYDSCFEGVWACSSLLHVPSDRIGDIFHKIEKSLVKGGVFYCSFKYGEFEGNRNGRYFLDLTETALKNIISTTRLRPDKVWLTSDVRQGRSDELWLNAIMIRQ